MSRAQVAVVSQTGNRVDVKVGGDSVFYEVDGLELPQLDDVSFLLWHLAAHGMESGADIHVAGRVDPVALANVRRMCRTWAMWQPGKLHRVNMTADEVAPAQPPATSAVSTFYSGGVDSTYMLLEKGRQEHAGTAVTVHGMDYDLEKPEQFAELIRSTDDLLAALNYKRVIIRSDAKKLARGYHAYAMAIAGHAWLLSATHGSAEMAADFTREQDLLTFPWTSNSITNQYFRGTHFSLTPMSEDSGRTQKVEKIASNLTALNSVTFCKIKGLRPKNCGKCQKCLRTKAMFMVTIGNIPDIFVDREFDESWWRRIDLSKTIETAFFLDMYETARDRGTIAPGLQDAYERRFPQPIRSRGSLSSVWRHTFGHNRHRR